jgi:hypothetical protein
MQIKLLKIFQEFYIFGKELVLADSENLIGVCSANAVLYFSILH